MKDVYQSVTDRVIAAMEKGVQPWRKPWSGAEVAPAGMPHNAVTGRPYHGINVALLMMEAMDKGYQSTGWITYNQAAAHGGLNWKGQKATEIVFFQKKTKTEVDDAGDEKEKSFLIAKSYRVFNLDQMEGDTSDLQGNVQLDDLSDTTDPQLAKQVRDALDVAMKHRGDRAFYRPATDEIVLPPRKAFKAEHGYAGTLLHEATHATGAKHRLDRDLRGRFGDESYAAEELVAELGATFLCASLNIDGELENHASYLANWLKVLRNDKRAIFTAASKAQQATDYVLAAMGYELESDYSEAA